MIWLVLGVFCGGLVCGMILGEVLDRTDVFYICPRCKRHGAPIIRDGDGWSFEGGKWHWARNGTHDV